MTDIFVTRRQLLGVAALLGISACTPRLFRESKGADSFSWALPPPESAGMTSAGMQGIRAVVQKFIDSQQITGAVTAIARNNQLVWFEAQGKRDLESGAAMRKDDLFRMASSTKVVTAVAVLCLMDEGKLSIDDKLSRYIPAFSELQVADAPLDAKDKSQVHIVPAQREITLKDLLTHTSGLSSWGLPLQMGPSVLVKQQVVRNPDDTLASYVSRLTPAILDFQPGSRWAYSPTDGFDVLARVVEVVSGQPADIFIRERILEPLDMRNTWFHVPANEQPRIVPLYGRDGNAWARQKSPIDDIPPRYVFGAGGLYSTAHDFLNFELMLLNKGALNGHRVLQPETVTLMSRNHVGSLFSDAIPPLTSGLGFGLGVRVVMDAQKVTNRGVGAFGWGGAYGTETWADPQLGIAGVILVQQPVQAMASEFQTAVRRAIAT